MDLIAKAACRGCPAALELTVRSTEQTEEELEAAGPPCHEHHDGGPAVYADGPCEHTIVRYTPAA